MNLRNLQLRAIAIRTIGIKNLQLGFAETAVKGACARTYCVMPRLHGTACGVQ